MRLVQLLREKNIPVTVITASSTDEENVREVERVGATVILGDFRRQSVREQAQVGQARAILLATSNDTVNLEAALDMRHEAPQIPLIMRFESEKIASRLESDFGIHAVFSPPRLAAADFANAALQDMPPVAQTSLSRVASPTLKRERQISLLSSEMRGVLWVLGGLYVIGMILFHFTMHWSWLDSAYFTATVITTVGFGDYNLQMAPPVVKLFGIVLMFGGVTLVALLISFLTNYVLSGAAGQARVTRHTLRMKGHVIVCGLGSVGVAIVGELQAKGIPVVAIDAPPEDEYYREILNTIPVLLGDATHAEILKRAGIRKARAVIAATSSDTVNLEIGLMAQSLVEEIRPSRPLRLVLRCFDPDLARRVHALSHSYTVLSSTEIAAPLFIKIIPVIDNSKKARQAP